MSNKKNKKQRGGFTDNFEWWQWLLVISICIYFFIGLVFNKWNPAEWLTNSLEEGEKTGYHLDPTTRPQNNNKLSTQKKFESFQHNLFDSVKKKTSIGFDPSAGPYEHPKNRFSPSYSSPNSSPNYYFDK